MSAIACITSALLARALTRLAAHDRAAAAKHRQRARKLRCLAIHARAAHLELRCARERASAADLRAIAREAARA